MVKLRSKLEEIASKSLSSTSLYGLNETSIPSKKLSNIKNIHDIGDEEILFLYDSTLFGSAKDGMVFTDKGIHWREKLGNPQNISYKEIMESTANKNTWASNIFLFDNEDEISINDDYNKVIRQVRENLIETFTIYEEYYRDALILFGNKFTSFVGNGQFSKVVEWDSRYRGLFLKEEDVSVEIKEALAYSYFKEKNFIKSEEFVEELKEVSPEFYEGLKPEIELGMKMEEYYELDRKRESAILFENFEEAYEILEEQRDLGVQKEEELLIIEKNTKEAYYDYLNTERKEAVEYKDYKKAYFILDDQKKIGIKTSEKIEQILIEIKENHFKSLDEEREVAIEEENYTLAFSILEEQSNLDIKDRNEMDEVRILMEEFKSELLEKYHEELKLLVDSEHFLEADEKIKHIHKIEASYPLEKEEILLMIYQYEIDEAKEAILNLTDGQLKSELEEVLRISTKILYEEIRTAVRSKDNDYFKFFPNLWNNKDEYGMSALHYFALEGDIDGIIRSIKETKDPFITANIYGHNLLDLIGFTYDSRLSSDDKSFLETLKSIRIFDYDEKIEDRINFIETGEEGEFVSYNISKELSENIKKTEISNIEEIRLSDLNKRLISIDHFNDILEELEQSIDRRNSLDDYIEIEKDRIKDSIYKKEIKEHEDYPIKDEFITTKEYIEICNNFVEKQLSNAELIEEYDKDNRDKLDKMFKLLKNQDNYFVPNLLAFIELKEESFEMLAGMENKESVLEIFNLYFPVKAPNIEIGNYNADKEIFFMLVDEEIKELTVPLDIAKEFKESFTDLKFMSNRYFEDDLIIDVIIYEFKDKQYILPFEKRRNISNYKF